MKKKFLLLDYVTNHRKLFIVFHTNRKRAKNDLTFSKMLHTPTMSEKRRGKKLNGCKKNSFSEKQQENRYNGNN